MLQKQSKSHSVTNKTLFFINLGLANQLFVLLTYLKIAIHPLVEFEYKKER